MTYLLQVSTCWIVLFAIYMLFLRKETFFSINRYYLLGALILGLTIPFLGSLLPANQTSTEIYQVISQVTVVEFASEIEPSKSIFTWMNLMYLIYFLGALMVFSRFIYGLKKIYEIYKNATKTVYNNFTLIESPHHHLPFSFFHFIFISTSVPLNKDIEKILKHEELHANQWHSLDIVIIELLQVFFWFNPILIFYKQEIRHSHEFLADAYVTKDHNRSSYGQLLLRQSTSGLEIALANHFFHSQIKKRITMMYKEKSKRPAMVKYLVAIPVLAAMLFIFSSSQMGEQPQIEKEEMNSNLSINKPTANNYDSSEEAIENNLASHDTNAKKEALEKGSQELFGLKSSVKNKQLPQGDPIFKVVEEMPRFPGCETMDGSAAEKKECAKGKMLEYIYSQLKYPTAAKDAGIEGMCVIRFIVEKDGQISEGTILRNIGGGCGEESLKIVNTMPKWIPGKQKGQPVNVQYTLPVRFKLEGKQSSAEEKKQIGNIVPIREKSDDAIKDNLEFPDQKISSGNNDKEELFKVVEEMPRFSGCESMDVTIAEKKECAKAKMLEFINTNIKYPKEARDKGIEGVAVIQLVIERDGSVSSSTILRDPGAGTGTEAKRVIDKMPNWIPGKQRGKNVRVQYVLPIKYKLDGDKASTEENDKNVNEVSQGGKSNLATKNNLVLRGQNSRDELLQNVPNPFREQTVVGFNLAEAAPAIITVYDVAGKVIVKNSIDGVKGYNSVNFTAAQLGSQGVLYYTLESGKFSATKKMIMIENK